MNADEERTSSARRASRPRVSAARIAVWGLTGAVGAYLVLTGIFGILAKG